MAARIRNGRAEKSILLTGLRGVGKTVLLNRIALDCEASDYQTIQVEAHEGKSLASLLAPHIRSQLIKLDRLGGTKQSIRKGMSVLKSFISSVKVTFDDLSFGLDIEPEPGTADSGDLEIDLPQLFVALAEAAQERNTAIALLIDEVQYFSEEELSALIMAMHKMQQRQLPLILIGAGLPILPRLAGESKSYAERLFSFPAIGPLPALEAAKAITVPIAAEGEQIDPAAVAEIVRLTQGYPYFLQEWGYQVWNHAPSSPIQKEVLEMATDSCLTRLDENFFRVRYDRLTPSEKKLLRAMAELGAGPYPIGQCADLLGIKVGSLSPRRAKLIAKGMIYSPNHGDLDFTVPLFDDFMRRIIPNFSSL